jgi:hypothetical protein
LKYRYYAFHISKIFILIDWGGIKWEHPNESPKKEKCIWNFLDRFGNRMENNTDISVLLWRCRTDILRRS